MQERQPSRGKFLVTGFNRAVNSLADQSRGIQAEAKKTKSNLMSRTPELNDLPIDGLVKNLATAQLLHAEVVYGAIASFFEIAARASGGRRARVPQT